jgi:hypothetical protein
VIAHAVAAPVLARGRRELRLDRASEHAVYAELGGFVVVVVGRHGPLLPNGVVLTGEPRAGTLSLAGAAVWDPALRLGPPERGDEVLAALGAHEAPLERAVATRDPELAAAVAAGLIGRGPGLTPEGDDAVAATAAVVAAGPWPRAEKAAWLAALVGRDLRERTTALSATLLELACEGAIAEPVHAVLGGARWREALARLERVGHSTGRAYAVNAAAAARALGYGAGRAGRGQGRDPRGAAR